MDKTNFVCTINYSDFEEGTDTKILKKAKDMFENEGFESVSIQLVYDSRYQKRIDSKLVPCQNLKNYINKILKRFAEYHDEKNKPKENYERWDCTCRRTYTFYASDRKEE